MQYALNNDEAGPTPASPPARRRRRRRPAPSARGTPLAGRAARPRRATPRTCADQSHASDPRHSANGPRSRHMHPIHSLTAICGIADGTTCQGRASTSGHTAQLRRVRSCTAMRFSRMPAGITACAAPGRAGSRPPCRRCGTGAPSRAAAAAPPGWRAAPARPAARPAPAAAAMAAPPPAPAAHGASLCGLASSCLQRHGLQALFCQPALADGMC